MLAASTVFVIEREEKPNDLPAAITFPAVMRYRLLLNRTATCFLVIALFSLLFWSQSVVPLFIAALPRRSNCFRVKSRIPFEALRHAFRMPQPEPLHRISTTTKPFLSRH